MTMAGLIGMGREQREIFIHSAGKGGSQGLAASRLNF